MEFGAAGETMRKMSKVWRGEPEHVWSDLYDRICATITGFEVERYDRV